MKKMYEVYLEAVNMNLLSKVPQTWSQKTMGHVKNGLKWKAVFLGVKGAIVASKLAMSKAERICATQHGPGKERCLLNATIKVNKEKISKLRSMISDCSKSSNPEECTHKIKIAIKMSEFDVQDAQYKLQAYLKNLEAEGLEVQQEILPFLAPAAIAAGAKVVAGMAGTMILGTIVDKALSGAWKAAQAITNDAVKKCGTFESGPKKEYCVSKFRLQSYEKKLQVLQRVLSTCAKQKNPQKCQMKMQSEIAKLKEKIQIEKDNVTLYNKAAVRAAAANLTMNR